MNGNIFSFSRLCSSPRALAKAPLSCFFAMIFILLTMCHVPIIMASTSSQSKILSINLPKRGLPFHHIIPTISKQSGYHILISEEYNNYLVKGKFDRVSIEDFFRRSLRGHNYSLMIDDAHNEIQVIMMGKQMTTSRLIDRSSSSNENIADVPDLLILHQNRIQAQGEIYASLGVDPVTGLKTDALSRLKKAQTLAEKEKYEDQGIDPITGLHLEELSDLKMVQLSLKKLNYEDQGIDPISGMQLKDLMEIRNNQLRSAKEKYQDLGLNPITGTLNITNTINN